MSRRPPDDSAPPDDFFTIAQDWRNQVIQELHRLNQEIHRLHERIDTVRNEGIARFDDRREVVNKALQTIELTMARFNFDTMSARVEQLERNVQSVQTFETKATTAAWLSWTIMTLAITILGWFIHRHGVP